MTIKAQVAMVMNLDKCIGCHTCSVTCKQVWTNRPGAEYAWFNNVETRPGLGYPKRWCGPGAVAGRLGARSPGRLRLRSGGRLKSWRRVWNPDLPELDDYYDPWTYDYETLISAPLQRHDPVATSHSQLTGKAMNVEWGPNWDDNLAGGPETAMSDPQINGELANRVKMEYEQAFMFYLPRICEHCLNPSCVASCPSGAMYKREEDGIVLVDQDKCRGWRFCVSGCPYKKVYFNHKSGKAEKCTLCYPRIEAGQPTVCSETCVGRIRYLGLLLYDADRVEAAASVADEHDLLDAQRGLFLDPADPDVRARAGGRHLARLDRARATITRPRPRRALQGGAATAPRVPHHADGLVRATTLTDRQRTRRGRLRGRPRRPLSRRRQHADPARVPRQPALRRRHRRHPRRTPKAGSHARIHAQAAGAGPERREPPGRRRHDRARARRHVQAACDRQVQRTLRHPPSPRRARRPPRRTRGGRRMQPRLRGRTRQLRSGRPGHKALVHADRAPRTAQFLTAARTEGDPATSPPRQPAAE